MWLPQYSVRFYTIYRRFIGGIVSEKVSLSKIFGPLCDPLETHQAGITVTYSSPCFVYKKAWQNVLTMLNYYRKKTATDLMLCWTIFLYLKYCEMYIFFPDWPTGSSLSLLILLNQLKYWAQIWNATRINSGSSLAFSAQWLCHQNFMYMYISDGYNTPYLKKYCCSDIFKEQHTKKLGLHN